MTSAPRAIAPLERAPDVTIAVPGSKSHTNRALICAALADGRSTLHRALFADDTQAMLGALRAFGIGVHADPATAAVDVEGGLGRLAPGPRTIDARQSGTTGRFVLPLAALGPGPYVVDGHPQLRRRPFAPLVEALGALGAEVVGDHLPIEVAGGGLSGGRVELPGAISSQFLSGLLLAAPLASGRVDIELTDELVSKPYVDLTIATMAEFGPVVHNDAHRRYVVEPARYEPRTVSIEPDASAASYFFAAAAITGGRVRIPGLGRRSRQGDLGFVDVLARMGATVERGDDWTEVAGTGRLVGIDVDLSDMSDVAQTLAVVATFASSPTSVRGIDFIQHKETDRVAAVVDELVARGVAAERSPGGFTIHPGAPRPGIVSTYDDHRMAMSFALLGLVHPGVEIDDPGCVDKTFPGYFDALDELR